MKRKFKSFELESALCALVHFDTLEHWLSSVLSCWLSMLLCVLNSVHIQIGILVLFSLV